MQALAIPEAVPAPLSPEAAKREALRRLKPLPGATTKFSDLAGQPLMLTRVWGPRPPTKKSKSPRWNYAAELVDGQGVVHIAWSNHTVLEPVWSDDALRTALEGGATFLVQFEYVAPEGGQPYYTVDFLEEG